MYKSILVYSPFSMNYFFISPGLTFWFKRFLLVICWEGVPHTIVGNLWTTLLEKNVISYIKYFFTQIYCYRLKNHV